MEALEFGEIGVVGVLCCLHCASNSKKEVILDFVAKAKNKAAIEPLVMLLSSEIITRKVKRQIADTLRILSGMDIGVDAAKWSRWLNHNKP